MPFYQLRVDYVAFPDNMFSSVSEIATDCIERTQERKNDFANSCHITHNSCHVFEGLQQQKFRSVFGYWFNEGDASIDVFKFKRNCLFDCTHPEAQYVSKRDWNHLDTVFEPFDADICLLKELFEVSKLFWS